MTAVEFEFMPGDRVETPFGDFGIVTMCAIEDSFATLYYVKRRADSDWFRANQLRRLPNTELDPNRKPRDFPPYDSDGYRPRAAAGEGEPPKEE